MSRTSRLIGVTERCSLPHRVVAVIQHLRRPVRLCAANAIVICPDQVTYHRTERESVYSNVMSNDGQAVVVFAERRQHQAQWQFGSDVESAPGCICGRGGVLVCAHLQQACRGFRQDLYCCACSSDRIHRPQDAMPLLDVGKRLRERVDVEHSAECHLERDVVGGRFRGETREQPDTLLRQ